MAILLVALIGLAGVFFLARWAHLGSSRRLGAAAWDKGTVLQVRVEFDVGDVSSPEPARAFVETRGDLEFAPELVLWLAMRTVMDVNGLHTRSQELLGLGVGDFLTLLQSQTTPERGPLLGSYRGGPIFSSVVPSGERPQNPSCAIVVNLIDGGASGMRWLCVIHLQGPVGDLAHVVAVPLAWDQLQRSMSEEQQRTTGRYIQRLEASGGSRWINSHMAGAKWIDEVIRTVEAPRRITEA